MKVLDSVAFKLQFLELYTGGDFFWNISIYIIFIIVVSGAACALIDYSTRYLVPPTNIGIV